MGKIGAVEGRRPFLGARGQDDRVRSFAVEEGLVHRHAHPHLRDPGRRQLGLEVAGQDLKLVPPRRQSRQEELTAQDRFFFTERHTMTALCGRGRGRHAGRAPADHQNLPGREGGFDPAFALMAGPGIAQALHRLQVEQVIEAPLGAGHAMDDFFFPARRDFPGKIGIGDERAAHPHQVARVVVDHGPGGGQVVDAMSGDHRHAHPLPDAARQIGEGPAGRLRDDLGDAGLMPAHVDGNGVGTVLDKLHRVFPHPRPADPAGHEIVAVNPPEHGIIRADGLVDGPGDLQAKPHAVFPGAAIGVRTAVRQFRKKLADQVAGPGEDLHEIKPGLPGALGRVGKILDGPPDFFRRKRPRLFFRELRPDGRRRHGGPAAQKNGEVVTARVVELQTRTAAAPFHRLRQPAQTGKELVPVGADDAAAGIVVHHAVPGHERPGAAPGPFGV